jgi:phage FluMu protein Com
MLPRESSLEDNGLQPVRCSACGRFLGYALILNGVVLMKCKNCKSWAIVAEGKIARALTTEQIYDMLPDVGRKV